MQRLFSTFPNGYPGAGLLILRLAAAVALVADSIAWIRAADSGLYAFLAMLGVALGIALALGLFTPVVAIAVTLIEVLYVIRQADAGEMHLLVAIVGISLAMLGPGTWSIDARLFGRKRIEL